VSCGARERSTVHASDLILVLVMDVKPPPHTHAHNTRTHITRGTHFACVWVLSS
jgi:hypothetical protein